MIGPPSQVLSPTKLHVTTLSKEIGDRRKSVDCLDEEPRGTRTSPTTAATVNAGNHSFQQQTNARFQSQSQGDIRSHKDSMAKVKPSKPPSTQ